MHRQKASDSLIGKQSRPSGISKLHTGRRKEGEREKRASDDIFWSLPIVVQARGPGRLCCVSEYHMLRCDGRPCGGNLGSVQLRAPATAVASTLSGLFHFASFSVLWRTGKLFSPLSRGTRHMISLCPCELCGRLFSSLLSLSLSPSPRHPVPSRVAQRRRVRPRRGMRHKRSRCLPRACVRACECWNGEGERFGVLCNKGAIKHLL